VNARPTIAGVKLESPLVLAPMAGVTDGPFRRICREAGAALVFTEMISADGLVRGNKRTVEYLRISSGERPIGVQLFGHDPAVMGEAAAIVTETCRPEFIDLNCGCPVRKVVGRKAGSALLLDLPLLAGIVEAMVRAAGVPVTVKMRTGWSPGENLALDAGLVAQEAGAQAVILHARSRSAAFSGPADWSAIAELKEALEIPVIGNGGVFEPADALFMLEETGCDAVMIGRAAMGNPWIFSRASSVLATRVEPPPPAAEERLRTFLRHASELVDLRGEERAVKQMRKQAAWYSKGLPGSSAFRRRVNECVTLACLREAVSEALACAGVAPRGGAQDVGGTGRADDPTADERAGEAARGEREGRRR